LRCLSFRVVYDRLANDNIGHSHRGWLMDRMAAMEALSAWLMPVPSLVCGETIASRPASCFQDDCAAGGTTRRPPTAAFDARIDADGGGAEFLCTRETGHRGSGRSRTRHTRWERNSAGPSADLRGRNLRTASRHAASSPVPSGTPRPRCRCHSRRRNIDLIEAGIDVALRMGELADSALTARKNSGKAQDT
jgi:hypothetical protein